MNSWSSIWFQIGTLIWVGLIVWALSTERVWDMMRDLVSGLANALEKFEERDRAVTRIRVQRAAWKVGERQAQD